MAGLFEISSDDLEFHELCDGGNYGCVYRGMWKSRGREVAVKKVLTLGKEAEVLSRLSHRNIVCFFGAVTVEPNVCLVMEYAEHGSLYAFLAHQQGNMITFEGILQWAGEIALGMNYLHNEAPVKVIHRDLKSKNVVISKDMICKICDFGASRFVNSTTKMTLVGTYPWMAPEVIQSFPISDACDVWSYGVVLWELLTHEVPFKGIEGFQIAWMVVENGKRLTIPSSCPTIFRTLMESCWIVDPKERPSFREILKFIERMHNDEELSSLTTSYLEKRNVWMKEIETSLEELKKLERNLGLREEELHSREKQLQERERNLEKQFHVVQLESYDVNTWREVDVYHWLTNPLNDRQNKGDLGQYADLFLHNHINGHRLLMLTQDDLRAMGVTSQGHIIELCKEIQTLKSHNIRLLHFPPLTPESVRPKTINHSPSTREIKLVASCVLLKGSTLQDTKWKMILDIYDEAGPDDVEIGLIKHVTFTSSLNPGRVYKISNSPFYMDKWASGLCANMTVECSVTFKDQVKRPHALIFDHVIDTVYLKVTERPVTLSVAPDDRSGDSVGSARHLVHSKSSPMLLKGAWGMRGLEHAVPPIDSPKGNRHQESAWSDVVTNKIPGQYPAHQPRFSPVPQVFSRSTSSRSISSGASPNPVSGSSLSSLSSYSPGISAEPSPQVDFNSRPNGGFSSLLTPPVTLRFNHVAPAPMLREHSQDSVFERVTPRRSISNGVVRFSVEGDEDDLEGTVETTRNDSGVNSGNGPQPVSKNFLTIAEIANNFLGYDPSRRCSTPIIPSSRDSSDSNETVDGAARFVRSGSLRKSASYAFNPGAIVVQNSASNVLRPVQVIGPRTSPSQMKGEEPSTPRQQQKKGRRKAVSRQTTMDSLNVHGGNPKWMWKN